jgi:hypothetical protein
MELTKSEIEIADRCISKRERQLAQWPRNRWLMLVLNSAIILLGHHLVSDGMGTIDNDKATDMQVSRALGDGPPPGLENRWAVGAMMKMSKILEARHQVVSASLMEVAVGYTWLLGGLIMVCFIVLRWKPSERDALICKLLRWKLQELKQDSAPNNRSAAQSPASSEVQS